MGSKETQRVPIFTAPPPRTLNVHKFAESRALELESLYTIIANRTNHDFRLQRNKRRRTTSHDSRIAKNSRNRKRQKLGHGNHCEPSDAGGDQKKLSRKMRRRKEFQKNPEFGFCESGDGTKRLRTHLWHAKRFTMVKRWGFYLPLGLQGRGRGSRAVLKWLKSGALVHDASYCCPVQLEGPEDSLLAILRMVLVPFPSDVSEERYRSVLCGVHYESAMLHHVGAPVSRLIAPVTYMWRPFLRDNADIIAEKGCIPNGCTMFEKSEPSTSYRQLWIWIHAAAFNEGFDALRAANQKQMDETGVSVSCFSLEGQLAKLEVMGFKAIQILQKILNPVSGLSNTFEDSILRKCSHLTGCTSSQLLKYLALEHAEHLPSQSILSLRVHDPRALPSKEVGPVPKSPSTRIEGDSLEEDSKESCAFTSGDPNTNKLAFVSLWSKPVENGIFLSDSKELWVSRDTLNPPVEENILCTERNHRRLKAFYLDNTKFGPLISESRESTVRTCSVLLLKHNSLKNFCTRWSIILPLSWVKAFWIPLVSSVAHAIGLRERRWIASDNGIPSFPFDFPDCNAYTLFMASESAASDQIAELRPLAVRPLRVPISPPWDCISSTIEEVSSMMGDFHTVDMQPSSGDLAPTGSIVHVDPESCGLTSGSLDGSSFQGFIARTYDVLNDHLNKINGSKLLLFPNTIMGKGGFAELMDKGRLSLVPKMINIPADRELCYLRVLLHAYKEGVFEEGAVICAPTFSDLSRLTCRSEEQEKLQIPQHLIKTYFTLQDSGKWKLQVPVDSSVLQSFRWPIGFVTTGFVRGSTKPVAEALCEATLLAQLREQQLIEMQEKGRPEILVLVRYLRSASYRLSFATIVLEQQKEDVEFM